MRKVLLIIVVLAATVSCMNPLSILRFAESSQETGSLVVTIDAGGLKTLLPPLDMTPASYTVTGDGPNGGHFEQSTAGPSVTIPELSFGDWTVTVDALNDESVIIGQGQAVVTVHAGQTQNVHVPVRPLAGHGTLALTITWPAAQTENPTVAASLLPFAGSAIALSFIIDPPGTGTCTATTIPTGYYTLQLELRDNDIPVAGAVEVVRIVKNETTSGQFDFPDITDPSGTLVVTISPELDDPIPVTLSGQVDTLDAGTSMTVTASVPPEVGAVTCVWYLNGVKQTTAPSFAVGSALTPGSYRVDVTAFSADGRRAGSATHSFVVNATALAQVTLEWDPNSEADLAGYKLYYGLATGSYDQVVDVGNKTTYTLASLQPNTTYYIAATAYNSSGLESGYSNEVIFNGS
jgi:hypothetical protein